VTTQGFLQALFAGCAGFLELRHLPADGEASQQFRPLGDDLDWVHRWSPEGRVDVYFGVYPRTRSAGVADAIASQVSCLFCDLDDGRAGLPQALAPTITVDSGTPGHVHCYWRLARPVAVADAESANRALARALGGDVNATDRARVLRLPGTINSKTGREAVVTHHDPGATYRLEDFASLIAAETSGGPAEDADSVSGTGRTSSPGSGSSDGRQRLHQGRRNASLASLAGGMRRIGMEQDEILAALRQINRSRCRPELEDRELAKIARSISRYPPASDPVLGAGPSLSSSLYRAGDSDDDVNAAPVELRTLTKPGPRRWRVEGLMPADAQTILFGGGGLAKSLLGMLIADHVARGHGLFGKAVQQGRVLYLDWELGREEQTRRAYRVAAGLDFLCPAPGLFYKQMVLPLSQALPQIEGWLEDLQISLAVLDSFGLATLGDPTAAKDVVPLLAAVCHLPCTSLFIDHVRNLQPGEKGDDLNPYGSVYKFNIARSVIRVIRVDGDDVSLSVLLRQTKSNFGPLADSLGLRITFEEERICFQQVDPSSPAFTEAIAYLTARDRVYQALVAAGRASPKELADTTELKLGTVKNKLTELRQAGKAEPFGDGNWVPVPQSSPSLILSGSDSDYRAQEAPAESSSLSLPLSDDDDDRWEED